MAHALKYRFSWGDTGGNTRLVEIYEDGFAGTVENIEFAGPQPVTRRMRASRGDEDNIINGQEWQFDIVTDVANRHKFDPLFESSYQDFYGVFKKNGAITDKGWLKPENLERAAENPFYRITLSFVDGLADLKDIEFRKSDNSFYTGEMTMLEVIKEALSKMGIEIATRDFLIVSNLYEVSQMSVDANGFANDSALRVSTIDTRRFIDTQTGKTKADNCYRVIEKILFNFNVKLKVVNNQYWIVDYNESAYADENYTNGETFVHEVLWSDLTATGHTRTAINNHVDLTGKVFRRGGNYSKLQPIKSYDLTFKNKFLGKVPDVTLNDWANWTVAGAVSSSIDADGTLSVRCDTDNNTCTVTSPIFDITEETDREYIKVLFNYVLNQFFGSATGTVNFHFRIDKPFTDGFGFIAETNYFGTVWNDFISPNSIPFMVDNAGADPGSYQLRIVINVTTDAEILFTQPSVKKIVPLNTVGGATTTRDENFVITQANGIKSEEIETFFGDTGGLTDVGRITINGNLTTTWNHLRNEQLPIIEQILKHKLSNRQSHADIIRFDYLDENDIISLEKSIKIGSNYYEIIGLNKEYKQGNSTITVRQLFDPDVVYTLTSTKLRSADGSTTTEPYSGGTGTGDGGGFGGGDNPLFQSDPIYMQDDFFFDSSNNFNFNNVSTDRTLFNLYNDDLGGTSNLLASFDYDFTNDAFKIVNTDLNLDNNDITNINNFGGGGLPIGVNDDLDFGGTSKLIDPSFGQINPGWKPTKHPNNPLIAGTTADVDQFYSGNVIKVGSTYYVVGKSNGDIYGFESSDGISWTNETLILAKTDVGTWGNNKLSSPTLVYDSANLTYHLYFVGEGANGEREIGHATSSSALTGYTLDTANPIYTGTNYQTDFNTSNYIEVWLHDVVVLNGEWIFYCHATEKDSRENVFFTATGTTWNDINGKAISFVGRATGFGDVGQTASVIRRHSTFYMIITSGISSDEAGERKLYSAVGGPYIFSPVNGLVLDTGGTDSWDERRTYDGTWLKKQDDEYLTPDEINGKFRLYYAGHAVLSGNNPNTGQQGLAEFDEIPFAAGQGHKRGSIQSEKHNSAAWIDNEKNILDIGLSQVTGHDRFFQNTAGIRHHGGADNGRIYIEGNARADLILYDVGAGADVKAGMLRSDDGVFKMLSTPDSHSTVTSMLEGNLSDGIITVNQGLKSAKNTFQQANGGQLYFNTDNADRTLVVINENTLGNTANPLGQLSWDYSLNALRVSLGNFMLKTGTSVNEIVTTIDGTSTDNQLATAKSVYDNFYKTEKFSLTSTQIKSLNTSPVTLISAPGAGNLIHVIEILTKLNFGTTAYDSTNDDVHYKFSTLGINAPIFVNDNILSSVSSVISAPGEIENVGKRWIENDSVEIFNPDGDPTGGDGTLDIYITYKILTL